MCLVAFRKGKYFSNFKKVISSQHINMFSVRQRAFDEPGIKTIYKISHQSSNHVLNIKMQIMKDVIARYQMLQFEYIPHCMRCNVQFSLQKYTLYFNTSCVCFCVTCFFWKRCIFLVLFFYLVLFAFVVFLRISYLSNIIISFAAVQMSI